MSDIRKVDFMVSSLFIGLYILLLCFLAIKVIQFRWKHKTSLGDGGVEELQRAVRAHGNLAENVPPFAIIIFLLEFQQMA